MNRARAAALIASLPALLPQAARAQAKGDPYKIGVTFPLTGALASSALDYLKAADVAVAEINKAGGVKGHPLALVVEDSLGSPEGGISAMRKLVQINGVQAILSIYTNVVTAQMPLADSLKVPFLCPAEAAGLMGKSQYGFSHAASGALLTPLLTNYWRAAKVKRVFSFIVNNSYGPFIAPVAKNAADAVGATYQEATFNVGESDYRGLCARAKDVNPDAIFVGAQGGVDETVIIKQLRELGVNAPIFEPGIFYNEKQWREGVGSYIDGIVMAGLVFDDVAAKDFVKEYAALTGHDPGYQSGEVYDMIKMFAWSIDRGGYSGEAIRNQLASLKGVPSVFGGTIAMDADHYSIPPSQGLYRVRGGKIVKAVP